MALDRRGPFAEHEMLWHPHHRWYPAGMKQVPGQNRGGRMNV